VTRVVHVVVAGEIGGAERMLVELASREHSAEHVIALFTPSDGLRHLLRRAGLQVHDRGRVREGPLPFLWRSLGAQDVAWLVRVLHDEGAGVVHLHTFASQVLGTRAARRAGLRVVRTEHSTRVYDDPSCWPFSRWSLARTDAAVAVSEHVRAVALARAPWAADRMTVIPNGVDADHFAPRQGPAPAGFVFAVVGRLETRKGIDRAIDAIASVPGARLEIIGDGAERGALESLARRRGVAERVRFHGYVDDTRPVLSRARAVLCTSRSEGLGIALLEGMAMGLPVVGFAVGGVPEIVRDGETGLLCPPDDAGALAEKMRRATTLGSTLETMGAAARARVVEHFSVEAMCAGYARVYARLW
jgi:glycosyltransferase involved in cell wall biosynthesis